MKKYLLHHFRWQYRRFAQGLLTLAAVSAAHPVHAASFVTYTDRASFTAALTGAGLTAAQENYESYLPGAIANGDKLGAFKYNFDPFTVAPSVVSDGAGGVALGGFPYDVFVGGDSITLTTTGALPLHAFGADFFYAPSFDLIPASIYRLLITYNAIGDQLAVDNDSLSAGGGSFFLGIIGDASSSFTTLDLYSIATQNPVTGDKLLVPAYQIDNLIYDSSADGVGATVPEPATYWLLLAGILGFSFNRRAVNQNNFLGNIL